MNLVVNGSSAKVIQREMKAGEGAQRILGQTLNHSASFTRAWILWSWLNRWSTNVPSPVKLTEDDGIRHHLFIQITPVHLNTCQVPTVGGCATGRQLLTRSGALPGVRTPHELNRSIYMMQWEKQLHHYNNRFGKCDWIKYSLTSFRAFLLFTFWYL